MVLLSIFFILCPLYHFHSFLLLFSSVYLSHFILVPMRKCWGQHSCVSSTLYILFYSHTIYSIAIRSGDYSIAILSSLCDINKIFWKLSANKLNYKKRKHLEVHIFRCFVSYNSA